MLSPGAFLAGVALPALGTGQLPDGVQALLLTHIQVGVHTRKLASFMARTGT